MRADSSNGQTRKERGQQEADCESREEAHASVHKRRGTQIIPTMLHLHCCSGLREQLQGFIGSAFGGNFRWVSSQSAHFIFTSPVCEPTATRKPEFPQEGQEGEPTLALRFLWPVPSGCASRLFRALTFSAKSSVVRIDSVRSSLRRSMSSRRRLRSCSMRSRKSSATSAGIARILPKMPLPKTKCRETRSEWD